jgi:drug/metabolite transporter (DMT)-like permease
MMFNWLLLAIIGHLCNATAFIVDKSLLTSTFKRSSTYAALMGFVSIATCALAPWVKQWPPLSLYPIIICFGAFFVFALWAFFEALRRSEASRVVPVVGSLIPVFTLIGGVIFLHEFLGAYELLGFVFLLFATFLLTRGGEKKKKKNQPFFWIAVLASIFFAAASLCGKYAFDHSEFLGVLVLSRLFAACIGILIGLFASRATRMELFSLIQSPKKTNLPWYATVLAITGQVLGGIGFIMVHLAMVQGSAAVVNAMQAVQYAAIVLVAWFGGKRLRKLLQESRTARVIFIKTSAIILVGIGLALVSGI